MVLMFVHIAHAAVEAIRVGWNGPLRFTPEGTLLPRSQLVRAAELFAGLLILSTLAIPSLLPVLPLTVLLVTIAAFISGRLSMMQAILAAASLIIALLAYIQIQFPLPFLSTDLSLLPHEWLTSPLAWGALLAATAGYVLLGAPQPLPAPSPAAP